MYRYQLQYCNPGEDEWHPLTSWLSAAEVREVLPRFVFGPPVLYRLLNDSLPPGECQFVATGAHKAAEWIDGAAYRTFDFEKGEIPYPVFPLAY